MSEEVGIPIRAGNTQMEFTNTMLNRRLIRSAKNPMDKCTLVSIFPKEVPTDNPTLWPGKFLIPPGTLEDPSILVIGTSSWWKDIGQDQPPQEIVVGSIQVADSIIKDYSNGMLGCNMGDAMPGLFFVLGEHNVMEIKMKYRNKLEETKVKQDNWYKILVRLADSLWSRTGQNPLAIWDEMRLAARSLNFNDKPWLKDFQVAELVRCKACGGMKNPEYPICPTCKSVDLTHPLAKDLKFAI